MKKKISVNYDGKCVSKEIEIRNQDHFSSQLKYKQLVKKNKKKYSRKRKHKDNFD